MLTLWLRVCPHWCCCVKKHFIQMRWDPTGFLIPSRLQRHKGEERGRREKCVCVRRRVSLRGGGGEDCFHCPITKKQALRRGPIITVTRARFHGDDAGMMLPAYWLFKRAVHTATQGGCRRQAEEQVCPVPTRLDVLLQLCPRETNVWWGRRMLLMFKWFRLGHGH